MSRPRITRTGPKERQRVSRACDACKKKKIRCSGTRPCIRCVEWSIECLFNAEYNRGKPRSRQWNNAKELPKTATTSMQIPEILAPSNSIEPVNQLSQMEESSTSTSDPNHSGGGSRALYTSQDEQPCLNQIKVSDSLLQPTDSSQPRPSLGGYGVNSSRNSPEPFHTDRQGQYVGSSSGVSFLLRVQKRLHLINSPTSNSSIFPSGDPHLPSYDAASFILPPKADAQELLDVYFSYAMPTYRFLHRPTVEQWLDEFYENFESNGVKEGEREKTAILLVIFAHARKYSGLTKNQRPNDGGARYFHAAERQLGIETGPVRLTSVQARLCQCFYLLACSKINHCRSLFGTVAHLIHALGMHRKRKPLGAVSVIDHIDQECRKRVFWCAYNTDKYLSAVLGRPSIFHDDDLDQDLPSLVNDEDLSSSGISTSISRTHCIMIAPVLHAKLGRMLSGLLKELYSIKRVSEGSRIEIAARYSSEVKAWRSTHPAFLDPQKVEPSLLMPILQRQSRMLSLAYAHTVILINRPFLLSNFASLKWKKAGAFQQNSGRSFEANIKECLDAAMIAVGIVDDYSAGRQVFPAFWFTQYVAFCAVVILYVYTIQRKSDVPSVWSKYLEAAEKCQEQLISAAKDNSLAQRYKIVLEELKLEATQQTSQTNRGQQRQEHINTNHSLPETQAFQHSHLLDVSIGESTTPVHSQYSENGEDPTAWPEDISEQSPNSLMADLTSWEEFDYLVMDCMGNANAFGEANINYQNGGDSGLGVTML